MFKTDRFPRSLVSGSLAIGVTTAASLASFAVITSPAEAAVFTLGELLFPGTEFTLEDKRFYNFQSDLDTNLTVQIFKILDVWTLEINAAEIGITDGFFSYSVDVIGTDRVFAGVQLDSDFQPASRPGSSGQVKKFVEWAGGSLTLVSPTGIPDPLGDFQPLPSVTTIQVKDTFKALNGGVILEASNKFIQAERPGEQPRVAEPGTVLALLAVGGLGFVSKFRKQS